MPMFKLDQTLACPHCDKPQEGVVQDYTLPGRTGAASAADEDCWECGNTFRVTQVRGYEEPDDTEVFLVEKVDPERWRTSW